MKRASGGRKSRTSGRRRTEPVQQAQVWDVARESLAEAVKVVRSRLGLTKPKAAIVLGSGLTGLADAITSPVVIPFADLPGFPVPQVEGHRGVIVAGKLEGVPIIAQAGRFHLYEGHVAATVALPVRVFAELGIETLIVTNAAGGLRPTFRPPALMLITDHVNLMWRNPIQGPVLPPEERFPDMAKPYDRGLHALATGVALQAGIRLEEGVYAAVLGPSYETPAEIRMLERIGADAVGMSTVPEVIVARARGMRVLGFSMITNLAAGLADQTLTHDEVLDAGQLLGSDLERLIRAIVRKL